jgi:ribosomal-protein-alanine N-acetyltransferase
VKLRIEPATPAALAEQTTWRYEAPYDIYNDDGKPVKNPERVFAARDEQGALVGFFYFEQREDGLFYGLGMRPDLTGRGLGPAFVEAGIEFARTRFRPERIILDVADFNVRARTVYERAGFRVTGQHSERLAGREVLFVDMELIP